MLMGNFQRNLIFIIFLSFIFDIRVHKYVPNEAFETGSLSADLPKHNLYRVNA